MKDRRGMTEPEAPAVPRPTWADPSLQERLGLGARKSSADFSTSLKSARGLAHSKTLARPSERRLVLGPKAGTKRKKAFHELGWGETPSNPDCSVGPYTRARRSLAPPLDGFMAPVRVQSLEVVPPHEPPSLWVADSRSEPDLREALRFMVPRRAGMGVGAAQDRGRDRFGPGHARIAGKEKYPRGSRISFAGLLCSLLVLIGCGRPTAQPNLVIINGPEPESLDPAMITGQADGRVVLSLFEGLTRFHPEDGTPIPGLADRWELSSDGRIYTFHIRTNAAWSTGEPLTAEDVVYSWRRVLDPLTACEYSGLLFYIKNGEAYATGSLKDPAQVGVTAVDPKTLRVELVDPTPFFLDLCALPTLCVVPKQAIEKHGDRWLTSRPLPVSGAYELELWRLNDKVRLRKNLRYWDAARTRSALVDLLPCSLATTALNLYESREVDIVWDKELVPTELIDVLRRRPDFHRFDYLGTYFVRFNVTRQPFDDVRVRQALALAIDKRRLVEKFTNAGEKPADHLVPPGLAGYQSPPGLGFSPENARRLLAEAGFPGGRGFPRFAYLYNSGKTHEQIAVEMQEMWRRELGLRVELRQQEMKVYFQAMTQLDYDLCRSSWIGDYSDPNTFLDLFMSNNGNNRTGWKSPAFDRMLREANAQPEPARRAGLLRAAESLLIQEAVPIVPIYFYAGLEYYDSEKIQGIYQNPRSEHPLRAIGRVAPPTGAARANSN